MTELNLMTLKAREISPERAKELQKEFDKGDYELFGVSGVGLTYARVHLYDRDFNTVGRYRYPFNPEQPEKAEKAIQRTVKQRKIFLIEEAKTKMPDYFAHVDTSGYQYAYDKDAPTVTLIGFGSIKRQERVRHELRKLGCKVNTTAIKDLTCDQLKCIFQSVMIEDEDDAGFNKLFKNGVHFEGFYDMSFNALIDLLLNNGTALLGPIMIDFEHHKVVGGYSMDRDVIGLFAPRKRIVKNKSLTR